MDEPLATLVGLSQSGPAIRVFARLEVVEGGIGPGGDLDQDRVAGGISAWQPLSARSSQTSQTALGLAGIELTLIAEEIGQGLHVTLLEGLLGQLLGLSRAEGK